MRCPNCHQEIPETRLGVRLTPLKARIFDLVRRAGKDGIPGYALREIIDGMSVTCLKSHIWQINDLLEDTGYRIKKNGKVYALCRS